MIILRLRNYRLVLVHIVIHATSKASCFVSSRVLIHASRSQDIRGSANYESTLGMVLLLGVGGMLVGISKEILRIRRMGCVFILVSWYYSKNIFREHNVECNVVLIIRIVLLFLGVGGRPVLVSPLLLLVGVMICVSIL